MKFYDVIIRDSDTGIIYKTWHTDQKEKTEEETLQTYLTKFKTGMSKNERYIILEIRNLITEKVIYQTTTEMVM